MDVSAACSLAVQGLALGIPVTFGVAALLASRAAPLRRASLAASVALGLAVLVAVGAAAGSVLRAGSAPSIAAVPDLGVRADALTVVMLLLVCGIAAVIARYSRSYLEGDPGRLRYARWLTAALGAVTALVVARNLAVIAVAWTATSVALHQLLTFYGDRTPALVAAHKKFLLARLADACLLGALVLLHLEVRSLDLDALDAWARSHPALTPPAQLAAVLLVVAVSLRSAQLPFHGWLTQVMEAPTPVSALLHAGVVNIGGFVMIRLAPLMAHAPVAQALLVAIGLTTTVLGTLVMGTRVSVKVALAWSTCAQMGFMLVQCGLGAWHLAFLHLVAHSLYKAHAFLAAGGAVEVWRVRAQARGGSRPPGARALWTAMIVVASVVAGSLVLASSLGLPVTRDPSVAPLAFLLGMSLVPLAARGVEAGRRPMLAVALRSAGVVVLYFGGHGLVAHALAVPDPAAGAGLGWGLVAIGFAALFAVQTTLLARPEGRLARALHPWLFAGFYLDERFTRLTFRVWPPRLPRGPAASTATHTAASMEA